jgi:hypothetical protein
MRQELSGRNYSLGQCRRIFTMGRFNLSIRLPDLTKAEADDTFHAQCFSLSRSDSK